MASMGAASPRGEAADAGGDKGKKKGVIESMKEFFAPRSGVEGEAEEDEAHMSIGSPTDFKQLVHVTVDATSSSGFNGTCNNCKQYDFVGRFFFFLFFY
jgi:hypothetical protein